MPTWDETLEHLRERFKIAVEEASWVGLVWRFGGDFVQGQRVELAQAFGQPHLLILSDVLSADLIPPKKALQHNMTLAVGALAIAQGTYVLRHVMPLENLTWAVLDAAMEYVAHEAARLRKNAGTAFGNYAD
jgi:hypothetical protein